MKCEFRILSGARAGHRDVLDKAYVGLGRHPMSDVRFDAEKDLDASTRHAAILLTGDQYILRDLGSTNGTFVNGHRVETDTILSDGDVVKCGVHGPEVSFHMMQEHGDVVMEAVPPPSRPRPRPSAAPGRGAADLPATVRHKPPAPAPAAAPGPSKTSVLRAEIRTQQSKARSLVLMLGIIIIGAASVLVWQGRTATHAIATANQVRDSALAEIQSLLTAKMAADSAVTRLTEQMRRESDPARRRVIQTRRDSVVSRRDAIETAQGVDYNAIVGANRAAVAVIFVQFAEGAFTGTAFGLSGGRMLTNRHVVLGRGGERPSQIAIQFSGSSDVHPARLVRVASNADLALVQLESAGPFPAVRGLATDGGPPEAGNPIALLGFPGGGGEGVAVPNATLMTGTITSVIPDSLLVLDSYSGTGASGSPIFDRNGRVVGVEFGGIPGTRIIHGLPIRRALALLGN